MTEEPAKYDELHGRTVLGISECTRCDDRGDDPDAYDVRGVARIGGNLCVDCVKALWGEP
jgi:hypothetical protein